LGGGLFKLNEAKDIIINPINLFQNHDFVGELKLKLEMVRKFRTAEIK